MFEVTKMPAFDGASPGAAGILPVTTVDRIAICCLADQSCLDIIKRTPPALSDLVLLPMQSLHFGSAIIAIVE